MERVTTAPLLDVRGLTLRFGGVTALGCTIGQGLSGLSTLAIGSILTFLAIVVGPPLAGAPWSVLLELSDTEGEAPARERFESLLGDGGGITGAQWILSAGEPERKPDRLL